MTSTVIPVCNFNCVCMNADCTYRHYITYKERKVASKVYEDKKSQLIAEDKSEVRKANCLYGQMCRNIGCNFRHQFNADSRFLFIDSFEEEIKKKNATTTLQMHVPKKLVVVKEKTINTKNLFESLPEDEDIHIKNEKKELVSYNVPTPVDVKMLDLGKETFRKVLLEGREKNSFEKMMKMEGKVMWADYSDDENE